jgi:hypothetical protein
MEEELIKKKWRTGNYLCWAPSLGEKTCKQMCLLNFCHVSNLKIMWSHVFERCMMYFTSCSGIMHSQFLFCPCFCRMMFKMLLMFCSDNIYNMFSYPRMFLFGRNAFMAFLHGLSRHVHANFSVFFFAT